MNIPKYKIVQNESGYRVMQFEGFRLNGRPSYRTVEYFLSLGEAQEWIRQQKESA